MDQTLILNKILEQQNLNIEESMYIFNKIMSGELDDIKITSILIGLKSVSYTHLTLPTSV